MDDFTMLLTALLLPAVVAVALMASYTPPHAHQGLKHFSDRVGCEVGRWR